MPTSTLPIVMLNEGLEYMLEDMYNSPPPLLNMYVGIFVDDISISAGTTSAELVDAECTEADYARIILDSWYLVTAVPGHPRANDDAIVFGPYAEVIDAYGIMYFLTAGDSVMGAVKFPELISIPIGQTLIIDTSIGLSALVDP